MKPLAESTVILVAHGFPDAPPAGPVRDFVAAAGGRVISIHHPLSADERGAHVLAEHRGGKLVRQRRFVLPSRPPLTYPLDPLTTLLVPRADLWIGFDNLAAGEGLARRRLRRAGSVVYWAVDFVPERFGAGTLKTRAYDFLDRRASVSADLRVELTAAARDARTARLHLGPGAAPVHVAPIGVWLDGLARTTEDGWRTRRVVYAGGLVERQGVHLLLDAIALLPDVSLDVVGRGPLGEQLRNQASRLGIADRVRFHGFLADHRDVERVVAGCAVAVAPYLTDSDSFTRYADPAKLRMYAGAGLPIVMTDVPPNAGELGAEAGAELVEANAGSIAAAVSRALESPEDWTRRRAAALGYANGFDWGRIVAGVLERVGFRPEP